MLAVFYFIFFKKNKLKEVVCAIEICGAVGKCGSLLVYKYSSAKTHTRDVSFRATFLGVFLSNNVVKILQLWKC